MEDNIIFFQMEDYYNFVLGNLGSSILVCNINNQISLCAFNDQNHPITYLGPNNPPATSDCSNILIILFTNSTLYVNN